MEVILGLTVMCDKCVECPRIPAVTRESLNTFSVPRPACFSDTALRGQSRREGESRLWGEAGRVCEIKQTQPSVEATRSACAKALGLAGQQEQWGWVHGVTWNGRDWGAVDYSSLCGRWAICPVSSQPPAGWVGVWALLPSV